MILSVLQDASVMRQTHLQPLRQLEGAFPHIQALTPAKPAGGHPILSFLPTMASRHLPLFSRSRGRGDHPRLRG